MWVGDDSDDCVVLNKRKNEKAGDAGLTDPPNRSRASVILVYKKYKNIAQIEPTSETIQLKDGGSLI